jgi:hypothetical protein
MLCWCECGCIAERMRAEIENEPTEVSTRNLLVDKWRPVLTADNRIAVCEPIV